MTGADWPVALPSRRTWRSPPYGTWSWTWNSSTASNRRRSSPSRPAGQLPARRTGSTTPGRRSRPRRSLWWRVATHHEVVRYGGRVCEVHGHSRGNHLPNGHFARGPVDDVCRFCVRRALRHGLLRRTRRRGSHQRRTDTEPVPMNFFIARLLLGWLFQSVDWQQALFFVECLPSISRRLRQPCGRRERDSGSRQTSHECRSPWSTSRRPERDR